MQATKNKDSLTSIGLDSEKSKKIERKLDQLLSGYSIFYQNVRGFHWNIEGSEFFVLHEKFEDLYEDLKVKIDEIAERIVTLGGHPEHNFSEYLENTSINEAPRVNNGKEAVDQILESLRVLLSEQRALLELTDKNGDEGTNSMMSDYISEQEKVVWMFNSYLS